jgi:predicted metal-dependent hydrolase
MTRLEPDAHLDKHKARFEVEAYIKRNNERLMRKRFANSKQPISYADAKYMEVELAIKLRELGYAVWQA